MTNTQNFLIFKKENGDIEFYLSTCIDLDNTTNGAPNMQVQVTTQLQDLLAAKYTKTFMDGDVPITITKRVYGGLIKCINDFLGHDGEDGEFTDNLLVKSWFVTIDEDTLVKSYLLLGNTTTDHARAVIRDTDALNKLQQLIIDNNLTTLNNLGGI
jgi:hypothetical protein